ncbi:MAG: hypothetical protein JXQ87_06865 [Bacteroidia bacterium]
MKSFLVSALLVFSSGIQQSIEVANLKFEMDEEHWKLAFNNKTDNFTTVIYKRNPVLDDNGVKVIPSFSFIVEPVVLGSNVITYSAYKRSQVPFEVTKVISSESGELTLKNAVGYFGEYKDRTGNLHKVYVVHAICGDKGVQVLGDITKSVESKLDAEILKMLKSIQYLGEE